jgi:acyl-CoA reductase-like NAD-dependent aldehyde dehydrogenase
MKTCENIVGGRRVGSPTHFESTSPSTGEVLGKVPFSTAEQVAEAVAAAKAAQPAWAARPDAERKALTLKVADTLQGHAEHLAQWVAKEQGKPLGGVGPDQVPGARFEAWGCEIWTRTSAALDLPVEVVFEDATRRDELHRRPFGVIAAIAPWNWPLMIAIWQIIPAIRAGNTVVLKPSEYTSIASLEMAALIADILPPGVLNTVTGGGEVGTWLVKDPALDKIMFTGSGPTGAKIAATAAANMTPTTLELGGNDAAIVLPGADPKAIAMGLFWGAFINMGQTCAAAKRLYVHDSLHDAVVAELKGLAEAMPMGDPLADGTVMGPIQNRMQFDKVVKLVERTKADGRGTFVCGGTPRPGPGLFFPLTLVTGLQDGDPLVDEEQFGPVLPIIRYQDVDAAIASANRLDLGLGASVWGDDAEQTQAVALQLEAGTVWINQHGMVHPMVPFGGIKGSGWGVEFGVEGLKSVTTPRVISYKR